MNAAIPHFLDFAYEGRQQDDGTMNLGLSLISPPFINGKIEVDARGTFLPLEIPFIASLTPPPKKNQDSLKDWEGRRQEKCCLEGEREPQFHPARVYGNCSPESLRGRTYWHYGNFTSKSLGEGSRLALHEL